MRILLNPGPLLGLPFVLGTLCFRFLVDFDVCYLDCVLIQGVNVARIGVRQRIYMFKGPEGGISSPGSLAVFVRHTSNTDGFLMYANKGCRGMEQIERLSELHIFCAVPLTDIARRTDFFHLLLSAQRPETLKFGVMEGQANGEHFREQVDGDQSTVVVIDVVDVDVRIASNGCGDRLVPSGVENSRREVVHASRVRVSLRLCAEHRAIEDDVRNIVQDVSLDLNQVRLAENDDLNRFRWLTRRVLEIFDFGNNPD